MGGWRISVKVENKPLLEVRCVFCVAKKEAASVVKRGEEGETE